METADRSRGHTEGPRRIEVVKLEAYHVLSALKDHLRNSQNTTSLVPVLGTDTGSGKALQEPSLTRYFKLLIVKGVPSEDIFLDIAHIRPFLEVMKTCDSKQSKLIILCAEAISKFTQCEIANFSHKNAPVVLNTTFEELLRLFSTNVEPKEDLLTLKILKTLCDILRSKGGNLITNENICVMFKMIATLLTARHRNSAMRKLIHDEVVNLLQASLGHYDKNAIKPAKPKGLSRRISSTFIFISLLLAQKASQQSFSLNAEDSFLSQEDKDTAARFRNDFAILSQNVISFPALWNEFCTDVCVVGLDTLNQTMELGSLYHRQYNAVLPIVQVFIANSIYRMCFTETLSLYSLVLRSLKNLLFFFRTQMKAQFEALLTHIIASVVNHVHETKTYSFKPDIIEMNMEFIVDLCHNEQLIMELYANYDCDVRCANISDVLIKGVITCLVPTHDFDAIAGAVDPVKARLAHSIAPVKRKTSSGYTKTAGEGNWVVNVEFMALNALQGILKSLAADTMETKSSPIAEKDSHFVKLKRWKDMLREAAETFNATPLGDGWIPLVKKIGLLPENHTPKDVATFLKCIPDIDLKKVGEYLGTHKNPQFMDQVRIEFAKLHSFRALPIVMAIRMFLSSFRLPGESQQIERIIEVFASTYFEAQPLADDSDEKGDNNGKTQSNEELPDSKRPRWVIQENAFWQLNFTSYGVANVGTINDHIAAEEEAPYEHFKRQFMQNDIENILTNERMNLVTEAIKDDSIVASMQLTQNETTQEDDSKTAKNRDAGVVEGLVKPGFAYVANADVIFVLSYSIIMLNTDLHNSQIKKKMKLEDFIRNNKGINNGKNLPFEFLEDIYTTIKHHEIKLHKASEQVEAVKYDNFFWVDHVLQRQRLMCSFNTDLWAYGWGIKRSIFQLLCKNRFHHALNTALVGSQSISGLKRCIRMIWLFMRVALKFEEKGVINQTFQLSSISIDDTIGYRCQLSLALLLNVIATASNLFDEASWVKVMDTIIKLYYLNLLPLSFAALDIDAHVFGNCSALTDALVPPTIRFKRNLDARRGAGWLGGWTNFMFGKPVATNSAEQSDMGDCDFDELAKLSLQRSDSQQASNEQFLFLCDVQSTCDVPVENPYFNVDLIKRGVNPIQSKEDEDAIKEVTQAFGNDSDREELLPQVLAYMNLRLAFLNIYNVNSLFLGATTNVGSENFLTVMKVIACRIVEVATKDKETPTVAKPNGAPSQPSQGSASSKTEANLSQEGSLLEPCPKEIKNFNSKAEPAFFLGIFTKVCITVFDSTKQVIKRNGGALSKEDDAKLKINVMFTVKVFHLMASTLIFRDALEHIPKPDDVLEVFGLLEGEEIYEQIADDENLAMLLNTTEKLVKAVKSDTVLSSYLCIMMLKLILWFTQNSQYDVVVFRGKRNSSDENDSTNGSVGSDAKGNATSAKESTDDMSIRWSDMCLWLGAWLLQMLIHFENRVFYNHIEPTVKVISSIATSKVIARNNYFMKVMMAAFQRVTNHSLPFAKDVTTAMPGAARIRRIQNSVASVLPIVMRNNKCLVKYEPHVMAKYVVQMLLSLAIFSGDGDDVNDDDHNRGIVAIQMLIEMKSFATNEDVVEALWLYAIHALAIMCSMGPQRIYLEANKALNKILLKEAAPKGRCKTITRVVRIFDYLLAPILTNNFQYPFMYHMVALPLNKMPPKIANARRGNWEIVGPFSKNIYSVRKCPVWMENVVTEHLASYSLPDVDDINTRRAEMTSLICQYMLANMSTLSTMELGAVEIKKVKETASSLEYLLYTSDQKICSQSCVKRLITITNYILNVIIPSNGEYYTETTSDTYLESLKNFLLVLLTSPELKSADQGCIQHFKNDGELKQCLELVKDSVDMTSASPGEYALASLLAHTFSTTDFLKELFLDILRVVFAAPPPQADKVEETAEQAAES
ncbi:Sec7 domain containing protein, putative [Babesia bigemina]|uniref:Sec7 domain containing protein, putative n=1 Tax=Babesia bigemina TaxID=5866 RepID=A0A061DEK3_BABBI|nr:Sec7 domain containing protein, putative [Babesia bigemina]CDR97430.1 Sec7 domain containing protein, putative [Babesia bigemina]|eukprot:XP_012769616.1 Sec7 domain containing protein, putative [Babesia bigemina]